MSQNDSPEGLATKWFVLAAMGAMIYFSVVFSYVILGNDSQLEQPQVGADAAATPAAKVEHHD